MSVSLIFGGIMKIFLTFSVAALLTLQVESASIKEKPAELRTTRFLLGENQRATEPYTIRYDNRNFIVHPNVFSPKIFNDIYFFANNIHIRPGESFLDLGAGTGLISVMAAIKGAGYVAAVDINPDAVKNTADNVFRHHLSSKFRVYEGDLFDPIPQGQKFDTIFFFAPFMHVDMERGNLTYLERAIFDPNYHSLKKYLSEASQHLKPHGRLLLGFSTSHGQMDVLEELAAENGWKINVVAREHGNIPWIPGVDQVDEIHSVLLELSRR